MDPKSQSNATAKKPPATLGLWQAICLFTRKQQRMSFSRKQLREAVELLLDPVR
jgi:hypothetical protein